MTDIDGGAIDDNNCLTWFAIPIPWLLRRTNLSIHRLLLMGTSEVPNYVTPVHSADDVVTWNIRCCYMHAWSTWHLWIFTPITLSTLAGMYCCCYCWLTHVCTLIVVSITCVNDAWNKKFFHIPFLWLCRNASLPPIHSCITNDCYPLSTLKVCTASFESPCIFYLWFDLLRERINCCLKSMNSGQTQLIKNRHGVRIYFGF